MEGIHQPDPGSSGYIHEVDASHAELAQPHEVAPPPPPEAEPAVIPPDVRSGVLVGTFSTPHGVSYSSSSSSSNPIQAAAGQLFRHSIPPPLSSSSSSSSSSSAMVGHAYSVGSSSSSSLGGITVPQARLLAEMHQTVGTMTERHQLQQQLQDTIQAHVAVLAPRLSPQQRAEVTTIENEVARLRTELNTLRSAPRASSSSGPSLQQALDSMDARIKGMGKGIELQKTVCDAAATKLADLRTKYKVVSDQDATELPVKKQQELANAKAEWLTEMKRLKTLRQSLDSRIEARNSFERGEISIDKALGVVDVAEKRLRVLSERINNLEDKLGAIEQHARAGLGDEYAAIRDDPTSLAALRRGVSVHREVIQVEANRLEALGLDLMAFPHHERQEHIQHIAEQFLRAGMWPPRSDRPFSEFRQFVVQQMLTTALQQHPPQFLGQKSSGGVYLIRANVNTLVDGEIVLQPRPIGVFKPDDEAPGGSCAHISQQEVQPGLAPETASMRQALISQLGGRNTIDSVLVAAGHRDFKYWSGDSREIVEGDWQMVSPRVHAQRNAETLGERISSPPLKEGIFIAFVPQAQTMQSALDEGTFNPTMVDNSIWDRVYEDVAFANWDPNTGNQLLAPSREGSLVGNTTWHQIDLDKGLPAGFIAESNEPWWGREGTPQSAQQIPPVLAARIRERNVEQEIAWARHFWTRTLDARADRIRNSDMLEQDKRQALELLDHNCWSESQSTVLRVQDRILKAAVRDQHTMGEIREIIRCYSNPPPDLNTDSANDLADRFGVPESQAREFTAELHEFRFPDPDNPRLDIPNYIAHRFLRAKAAAMTDPVVIGELDPGRKRQMIRERTLALFEKEISNPRLWQP